MSAETGRGPARILLIEDNPVTRQMFRCALEMEGYSVHEAENGAQGLEMLDEIMPDLVIQDLMLPDYDGIALLSQLRCRLSGVPVPILVATGVLPIPEAVALADFDEVLTKPMSMASLVDAVRSHLNSAQQEAGRGRSILIVDDDPFQSELAAVRLAKLGFQIAVASGAEDALRLARASVPDVVLSDILMPDCDGFELTQKIREDPLLGRVPVVLISSCFNEELDRQTGAKVGADALISRSERWETLVETLCSVIDRGSGSAPRRGAGPLDSREARLMRQLRRQLQLNSALSQRCAAQSMAFSALESIAAHMAGHRDGEIPLNRLLGQILQAAGLSRGVFYMLDARGAVGRPVYIGYREDEAAELGSFFGGPEFLIDAVSRGVPISVPAGPAPQQAELEFLRRARCQSGLIVPILAGTAPVGVLFLACSQPSQDGDAWQGFARLLSTQLGQTLALSKSLERLTASERRHRTLIEKLERNEELLRQITETVLEVFYLAEQDGSRMYYVSPAYERIFGRSIDSLYRAPESWLEAVHPEDRERVRHAALSIGPDAHVVREYRVVHPDGETRWLRDHTFSVKDSSGHPSRVAGSALDITEEKRLEEQFRQSQKMEAVGQLAGGVAHDFNNLLTVIDGHSDFISSDPAISSDVRRDVEMIRKAVQRAAALTRQLLAFSRKQVLKPRVLDLNASVRDIEKMLTRLIGEHISLETRLDPLVNRTMADPGQIDQVLMNLAVNARDAMPEGGKLLIETRNFRLQGASIAHPGLPEGDYVQLSVEDTGCGMAPETMARIFEPFFTTKGKGKGTGLGLSTVYGIVKQSNGSISVSSSSGQGTRFDVLLPVAAKPSELDVQDTQRGKELQRKCLRVLIVEDCPEVRTLGRRALERGGHVVLEADGPERALELVADLEQPIDLMITDVVMPGMNGFQLARKVSSLRPNLAVLYMSGYTDDSLPKQGVLPEDLPFLEKPFTAQTLLSKIGELCKPAH